MKDKADRGFDAKGLAVPCRVFPRDAALKVAGDGCPRGHLGGRRPVERRLRGLAALVAALPLDAVRASQSGLIADMDAVADVHYGR